MVNGKERPVRNPKMLCVAAVVMSAAGCLADGPLELAPRADGERYSDSDAMSSPDEASGEPQAVITSDVGGSVPPGTRVAFWGEESFSDVVGWEWSLVSPPGSVARLLPAATSANVHLEPRVVGVYEVALTVTDALGRRSVRSRSAFEVVPGEGLFVELLWDTPTDDDQSDTGPVAGTDLDLHFVRPPPEDAATDGDDQGEGSSDGYFEGARDTFWYNPAPEWDGSGQGPRMPFDDTDGAGPESVAYPAPPPGTYRIGVHYFKDEGFGSSTATVRVYVDATLVFETQSPPLDEGDMWHVATIDWPSGRVSLLRACEGTETACDASDACDGACGAWVTPFFPWDGSLH